MSRTNMNAKAETAQPYRWSVACRLQHRLFTAMTSDVTRWQLLGCCYTGRQCAQQMQHVHSVYRCHSIAQTDALLQSTLSTSPDVAIAVNGTLVCQYARTILTEAENPHLV